MHLFNNIISRGHERIAFHHDPATGLRAMIALHSTKLGNALGGTRRWYYETEDDALYDVLRLSQGMTYKCAAAGLPMGGGKSVIMMPKPGVAATEPEARAMGRFVNTFSGVYIAAEDVGVNTQFVDWMALETKHVMGGEKVSVGGDPSPYTAQGVVNAMKAALAHNGRKVDFKGLTIAVQGAGNVGTNIVRILSGQGAKCIIADINPDHVARCVKQYGAKEVAPTEILTSACDILCPCALGGVIDGQLANQLNTKMVVPGANNVLDDPDEDAVILKSLGVTYVPDFVANAGGVIQLAGLYLGYDERKLADLIANIEKTSLEVLKATETSRSAYEAAVAVAEKRIAEGSKNKAARQAVHA